MDAARPEVANATANATAAAANATAAAAAGPVPGSFWDASSATRFLYANRHTFIMQARILALALSVIYVAAHGALQRPHSAAPREDKDEDDKDGGKDEDGAKKRRRRRRKQDDLASAKEGLQLSDAILMPFAAAAALVGLYYLIQYLQDPALLNRAIRGYTSLVAVASVGRLLGDVLHVAASLVFPTVWAARDGALYRVDAARRVQLRQQGVAWVVDPARASPFPDGLAAWLPRSLLSSSSSFSSSAWAVRRLVRETWSVRVALHGLGADEVDGFTLSGAVGLLLSGLATYLYYFLGVLPSLLNNLLGLGFCYYGLQMLSGTSFAISSLVLAGLFVYDIIMVFYTPFMVTVATTVEAPIKIVAGSGGRSSMLGLGDIVVPGIFICLCLRYDLYRHYARQIWHVETALETTATLEAEGSKPAEGRTVVTATTTATREVKATYVDPQGRWGDRLWTTILFRRGGAAPTTPGLAAARFPKPYFRTAMVAYVAGLAMAMGAVFVTGKGQPALLYLVPAVLLATWGRAAVTGDLKGLWAYTEDGGLDTKDVVVEVGGDGKPVEKQEKQDKKDKKEEEEKKAVEKKKEEGGDADEGHDVFLFAIRAPAESELFEEDF